MITKIIRIQTGLTFPVPVQTIRAISKDDFYYRDESRAVEQEVYLLALGLGSLLPRMAEEVQP